MDGRKMPVCKALKTKECERSESKKVDGFVLFRLI